VSRNSHSSFLWNSCSNHIPNRCSAEVVKQNGDLGGCTHILPGDPEQDCRPPRSKYGIFSTLSVHTWHQPLIDLISHSDCPTLVILGSSRKQLNRSVHHFPIGTRAAPRLLN